MGKHALNAVLIFLLALVCACLKTPEYGGEGAVCDTDLPCGSEFSCVDGTCRAKVGGGDAGDLDVSDSGADATSGCGTCPAATPICGGDARCVECAVDGDCAAGVCADGSCVECSADGDCADGVCVEGACVGCRADDDCVGGVCESSSCVQCRLDGDCAGGVCEPETNTCVQCREDGDCADGVCVGAVCRQCRDNAGCTDAVASTCDADAMCAPCTTNADCSHLSGLGVCADGTCVECTGSDYAACGGVCDSLQEVCTDVPVGASGLCEACISDAQCRPGLLCVEQMFERDDGTGPALVGRFCLWDRDSTEANGPGGACSTVRPYIEAQQVVSVDGVAATVCGLALTTCPGLNQFRTTCPTPGGACGADGFDDGTCVAFDAATNFCTVPCLGDSDCDIGATCDVTSIPKLCAQ